MKGRVNMSRFDDTRWTFADTRWMIMRLRELREWVEERGSVSYPNLIDKVIEPKGKSEA